MDYNIVAQTYEAPDTEESVASCSDVCITLVDEKHNVPLKLVKYLLSRKSTYFRNLFSTFPNDGAFTVEVINVSAAKDILLEAHFVKTKKVVNIRKQLYRFHICSFLEMKIDFRELEDIIVDPEDFDLLYTVLCCYGFEYPSLIETLRRNVPSRYDMSLFPLNITAQLNKVSRKIVVMNGKKHWVLFNIDLGIKLDQGVLNEEVISSYDIADNQKCVCYTPTSILTFDKTDLTWKKEISIFGKYDGVFINSIGDDICSYKKYSMINKVSWSVSENVSILKYWGDVMVMTKCMKKTAIGIGFNVSIYLGCNDNEHDNRHFEQPVRGLCFGRLTLYVICKSNIMLRVIEGGRYGIKELMKLSRPINKVHKCIISNNETLMAIHFDDGIVVCDIGFREEIVYIPVNDQNIQIIEFSLNNEELIYFDGELVYYRLD